MDFDKDFKLDFSQLEPEGDFLPFEGGFFNQETGEIFENIPNENNFYDYESEDFDEDFDNFESKEFENEYVIDLDDLDAQEVVNYDVK